MILVLLPGMDGTGTMFSAFSKALPPRFEPRVIDYPSHESLSYDALLLRIEARLPTDRPYVVVAESFSGPLGIRLAAAKPKGLIAVVLVATFHVRPVSSAVAALPPLLSRALFSLPLPRVVIRALMAGSTAPEGLVDAFRASVGSVDPAVLADRARAALSIDVSAEMTRAQVPMLFIRATRDALIREHIVTELQVLNPRLEIAEIFAPHLVLQAVPDEAAAVISAFVDRAAQ